VGTLSDRFVMPPFSVLDTRQGYWQERKRVWLAKGIKSEIGRGASPGGSPRPACDYSHRERGDGAGKPIKKTYDDGPEGSAVSQSGTSIFDPVLCELIYRWFTPPGGHVLDPFAGGSVRGIVAALTGFQYTGVDLRSDQVAANEAQWRDMSPWRASVSSDHGDAKAATKLKRRHIDAGRMKYTPYAAIRRVIDSGDFFAVKQRGELLGYCFGHARRRDATYILDEIAVAREGAGIGSELFGELVAHAAGMGCEKIDLKVAEDNLHAISWYARRGFTREGEDRGGRGHAGRLIMSKKSLQQIIRGIGPRWIAGDSQDIASLAPGRYDLIFSCPPYFDLERYSDDPRDLSNMDYEGFLKTYRGIVAASVGMLKPDRFACFVVGNIRDRRGFYRNFVGDTIEAFQDAGAILYNEAVLITSVGSLPIRVNKQFQGYRKLGKTHQNVLVFYKGDPKNIKSIYGDVDTGLKNHEQESLFSFEAPATLEDFG